MGGLNLKIGLLTSTRADFGIYIPLIHALQSDSFFEMDIIAFGTHLSHKFGHTIDEIEDQGFQVKHKVYTLPDGDSPQEISKAIGTSIEKFSALWANHHFDLIIALGDRYEMFAAVTAASPFNIDIAHIHAGETTLGAIDNAFRHSISLMSKYLFVSTERYKVRGIEIVQNEKNVYNVGALSIDNLISQDFYSKEEFKKLFAIDISKPYILSTFHPETVSFSKNESYINELLKAFDILELNYQIIITMPNSDTMGLMVREKIEQFGAGKEQVKIVESFGMKGYLTCMKYCNVMVGNTSSGFVEAAFFPKWVINIGDRQKGRIRTSNIIDCDGQSEQILKAIEYVEKQKELLQENVYGTGGTAKKIKMKLKELYNAKR